MTKYLNGLLLCIAVVVGACASTVDEVPEAVSDLATEVATKVVYSHCESPRPQICTREYNPVCAVKDTGVRCVTTPCPSAEEVTYATGCTACSDSKVIKHRPGACNQ